MLEFYRDALGFIESDRVVDNDGDLSSAFMRSDAEHHSFAVFRAPQPGPDHHAYEVPNWNAIRDWADHCGDLEIPIWWGPGRHGVGNNLFFMIEDPDGYKVEFSAELEQMTADQAYREWPHGPRALNLWGNAWMRS
jgi:catechol 2,3-dioxygenase-like lactoylglutathione lyase family enzyme